MPVREAKAAPGGARVSVVTGDEELLVERAVARLVAAAEGDGVTREVAAGALAPGELASITAPSLFDAVPVVVVRDAQNASKDLTDELARLAADPPPEVLAVVTHAGGVKGKALLASLAGTGARVIECPKITRVADRMDFVREEFRAAGRRIDDSGMRALIDAVGRPARDRVRVRAAGRRHHRLRSTSPWSPGTTGAGPRRAGSRWRTGRWKDGWPRRWKCSAGRSRSVCPRC